MEWAVIILLGAWFIVNLLLSSKANLDRKLADARIELADKREAQFEGMVRDVASILDDSAKTMRDVTK